MKKISASFKIQDNQGKDYESTIEVIRPTTSNIMKEIKDKICKVYSVRLPQILEIGNVEVEN